jgi:uroporphyrinogen-III synthase
VPQMPPLLLLTRPAAQSARFARDFEARFGPGCEVVTAPVMEIVLFGAPSPLEGVGGLVFTSENGVAGFAGASDARHLPAWCVGDRTARAARDIGLAARSAEGTAAELIAAIAADPPQGRLLHLRGEHARGDVCGGLAARGIEAEERIVYAQRDLMLDPAVRERVAAAPATLVPLFSPRSAKLVARQLAECPGRLVLATMSPAVTAAWSGPEPVAICEAARPDARAMMDALEKALVAAASP